MATKRKQFTMRASRNRYKDDRSGSCQRVSVLIAKISKALGNYKHVDLEDCRLAFEACQDEVLELSISNADSIAARASLTV